MGVTKPSPGLKVNFNSICRNYQPRLPPLGWLQPDCSPGDLLQRWAKSASLIQLYEINAPRFLAAVGTLCWREHSLPIPAFLYLCLYVSPFFNLSSPQVGQSLGHADVDIPYTELARALGWEQEADCSNTKALAPRSSWGGDYAQLSHYCSFSLWGPRGSGVGLAEMTLGTLDCFIYPPGKTSSVVAASGTNWQV